MQLPSRHFRGIGAKLSKHLDPLVPRISIPGPETGSAPLPILTMDEAAFAQNVEAMFAYVEAAAVAIAPHAKTPMSPELSRRLLDRGAWGLSVANLQQAAVFLEDGVDRLLVANQIGGLASAERFGALLREWPDADLYFFVDSLASLAAVARAGEIAGRAVPVLVEVGVGRAGARDLDDIREIVQAAAGTADVALIGVAAYEGAAAMSDADETRRAIAALNTLAAEAFALVRKVAPRRPLIISAGGSSFFDLVVDDLKPVATRDGNAQLVLRSGAIFFHDHGVYERALTELDRRGGFAKVTGRTAREAFLPALKVWAEVLSRPEPDLAICGMGMRDVSHDQDLPRPLAVYRDGTILKRGDTIGKVFKLNDQHAFLRIAADSDFKVGDIIAFGISHPCTCLDRWRLIFGRGTDGNLAGIYPTHFG